MQFLCSSLLSLSLRCTGRECSWAAVSLPPAPYIIGSRAAFQQSLNQNLKIFSTLTLKLGQQRSKILATGACLKKKYFLGGNPPCVGAIRCLPAGIYQLQVTPPSLPRPSNSTFKPLSHVFTPAPPLKSTCCRRRHPLSTLLHF